MNFRCSIILLVGILLTLASCGNGRFTTIRQGTWQGLPFTVQERSSAGLFASTNSLDWRIQLGKFPPVAVNASTHDWGPPYSTDVYGTAAYSFISGSDTAYVDTPFSPGSTGVAHTMLYVSPKALNEEQYETFLRFMTEAWPRLSDSLAGQDLREFPHIIGLVYGGREKFVHDFRGTYEGRSKILRIEPDGRVRFIDDNSAANESWSGLASKLHMPGKLLYLCPPGSTGAGLTVDSLAGFRDARGMAVGKKFQVVTEVHPGCQ